MSAQFIPMWIIGGPFVGLLALAFTFLGSSSMSDRNSGEVQSATSLTPAV